MTQLPWDRFGEPAEELPYAPAPSTPPPPTGVSDEKPEEEQLTPWVPEEVVPEVQEAVAEALEVDFASLAQQSFQAALNEALPGLKQNAMDLLQDSIRATVKGQEVDWAHPKIVATTTKGKELVVADAQSRSWRTLFQGLAIDLFFAVLVLIGTLTQFDPLDKATWTIFFVLLGKTFIQTSAAYFMRLKVTPTIKNAEGEKMALMPVPRPMLPGEKAG